jgi:hypothetical protein
LAGHGNGAFLERRWWSGAGKNRGRLDERVPEKGYNKYFGRMTFELFNEFLAEQAFFCGRKE